jgi:hypothetical protein
VGVKARLGREVGKAAIVSLVWVVSKDARESKIDAVSKGFVGSKRDLSMVV